MEIDVEKCIWKETANCQIVKDDKTIVVGITCDDCDWRDLPLDKEKILDRIDKEQKAIKRMMILTPKRRENEIKDKMQGCLMLFGILRDKLGVDVGDVDERIKKLMGKEVST